MPAELPGNEEERAARGLIEQAGKALRLSRPDMPASFLAQLLAARCPTTWCATARMISPRWPSMHTNFMSQREPDAPKIRCETVPSIASGERKSVTAD